jgi:hypothetical protein
LRDENYLGYPGKQPNSLEKTRVILTDTVLAFSERATFRSLGDSGVILMSDSGQLYSCNSTAEAFLRRINGAKIIAEIAGEIGDDFDVEWNVLQVAMDDLVSYLLSEKIIFEVQK